jgi:hypothetical protein
MKIRLRNQNHGNYYKAGDQEYELLFIEVDGQLVITTKDGKAIARLHCEVSEDDDGKATEQFFLCFDILDKNKAIDSDWAAAYV